MRVLRLYIQDCGVFAKPTLIDFTHKGETQDILCLAGVNGAGKTTVVELVFNLITLFNPNLSPQNIAFDRLKPNVLTRVKFAQLDILIEQKIVSFVIGNKEQIIKIDANTTEQVFIIEPDLNELILNFEDTVVKTPENEEEPRIIEQLKGLRDVDKFSERARYVQPEDSGQLQHIIEKIEIALEKGNTAGSTEEQDKLPFVYFFNAHDREIQDIRYDDFVLSRKPKYSLAQRYHPKRDDLKKTLIYYDYAYPEEFSKLKEWLNKYILVDKKIEKIDRTKFDVVIDAKNGRQHGLEVLSSGEESLLIIAMHFYMKAHRNSIFIIDEIDQSLHPEFQEKIITVIKKLQEEKQCQIIISSHSEIVWSAFKDKGLIDLTEMVL